MCSTPHVWFIPATSMVTPVRTRGRWSLPRSQAAWIAYTDADWEHSLGGMHALIWVHGALIAHGAVVQRQHPAPRRRPFAAAIVESVAVREDWRGQGLAGAVMDALEQVLAGCLPAGCAQRRRRLGLHAVRAPEAGCRGSGPTSALAPSGHDPEPPTHDGSDPRLADRRRARHAPPRSRATGATATCGDQLDDTCRRDMSGQLRVTVCATRDALTGVMRDPDWAPLTGFRVAVTSARRAEELSTPC